jgi:uncharacterized protein YaeQ
LRHYYADHALTLARHPSETDERMMVRLLAFALNADEALAFGRGLSAEDEPDLWRHDLTGNIAHWIDVGLPDERDVRRACGRAARVTVYAYGGAKARMWWDANGEALARHRNLEVLEVPPEASAALAGLAQRTMKLQCTVQEGTTWVSDGAASVQVEPVVRKELA